MFPLFSTALVSSDFTPVRVSNEINLLVHGLALLVADDWEGGVCKQRAVLDEFFRCEGRVAAYYHELLASTPRGPAHAEVAHSAHEVMRVLTDSWQNLECVPIKHGNRQATFGLVMAISEGGQGHAQTGHSPGERGDGGTHCRCRGEWWTHIPV